ncbi:MAG: ParB N-terminal domain-containing protein, partial [Candidatus Sumerlaeia bacterium]|nr:ParB N-terminal domain-containing protein [Candidatus Sumerlaeia bacterium]
MKRDLRVIKLTAIDTKDLFYVATYPLTISSHFIKAIKNAGIISPPLLEKFDFTGAEKYRIITGWRRVRAAQKLSLKQIPAFVLNSPEEKLVVIRQRLLISLCDNLACRHFNLVEIAHWLAKLSSGFPTSLIIRRFMPLFEISQSVELLQRYLQLATAREEIKNLAADGLVSLKDALILNALPKSDCNAFLRLAKQLNLGVNLRREFLQLIKEICHREGLSFTELLQREEILQIVSSAQSQIEKTEQLRNLLHRWRFPRMTQAEEMFEKLNSQLKFPPEIQL